MLFGSIFPNRSVLKTVDIAARRRHDAMTLPSETSLVFLDPPCELRLDGLLSRWNILALRPPTRVDLDAMIVT